jgi:predicted nucleotidyltransferase
VVHSGIRAPAPERDTVVVRRERALQLAERVLQRLDEGQGEWPLSLVKELYVFGSFARGATEPHDVDIDVEHDIDQRWAVHFADCLAYGRDHFSLMKRPPDRRQTRMPIHVQLPARSGLRHDAPVAQG